MKYTDTQEKAITLRDKEILVSAAAGSGKTSVLVERIMRRITDKENPVSIDRLLIMTFTNAAAKEMKDRLRRTIEDRLDENPEDELLARQAVLVQNAQITTIHGFCQNIIKEHFEEVSIDPNFRVADENECKLLSLDVLDMILENYYEIGDDEFLNAVECFSGSKNDSSFADIILRLYKFSQSHPEPIEYLDNCVAPYEATDFSEFSQMTFVTDYVRMMKNKLGGYIKSCEHAIKCIDDCCVLEPYKETFVSDLEQMKFAISKEGYDEFATAINQISYAGLGRVMSKSLDDDAVVIQSLVKTIRDSYKTAIKAMQSAFARSLIELHENMMKCLPNVKCLIDVVKTFAAEFEKKKREKNIIDFGDMEHLAIKILKNNQAVAQDYRDFYEEIYVDEYQDSNMTQEVLVNLIKRDEPNGNLFMVGDVKQSIYRFRQARPDLFMEKYDTFTDEESSYQRVLLNDNFRSRKEVIDAVNEIFAVLMRRELGGIEYDENASLKLGATYYPEIEDTSNKAELIIGIGDDIPRVEFEANIIANKIHNMISDKKLVFDTKSSELRPIEYRDIVILLRSVTGWQDTIKMVLENANIPVAISGTQGYFSTVEVKTVLAFLTVVDNPLQDIPLAAVMCSPLGDFSNEEMAIVRNCSEDGCLYEALVECANGNVDDKEFINNIIIGKCKKLVDKLSNYKEKSIYTPVYSLIRELIDTEYGYFVSCMDRGTQRLANLNMLMEKAEDYGKTSFKGLFNFVRYMELIQKYEIEDGEASLLGYEDNVVKIMTIHKSKGLEFPVCFVAGVDKKRNEKDEMGSVVWDAKYGIGVDMVDAKRRVKSKTIYKNIIKEHLREENIAEEIRVLYVALTRAREKLILVGWNKDENVFQKNKSDMIFTHSYMDMIGLALDDNNKLVNMDISYVNSADIVVERLDKSLDVEINKDDIINIYKESINTQNYEVPQELSGLQFDYQYADSADFPAKLSVSQIKHQAIEDEIARGQELVPEGKQLFAETQPDKYIPKFMRSEGENSTGGTFYGTAFHRILELWEYEKETVGAEDIQEFAKEMLVKYRMNEEQVNAIRADDIALFLNSPLGQRMYEAKRNGILYREQPFVIGVSPAELGYNSHVCEGEELVLVQGIIDAFILEDDGITIIDYKTDYVTDANMLITRYRAQLEYYGKALEQITGKNVKKLIIYSSRLQKEIVL